MESPGMKPASKLTLGIKTKTGDKGRVKGPGSYSGVLSFGGRSASASSRDRRRRRVACRLAYQTKN